MATNCAEEEEIRSRGHGVSNGTRTLGKSAIALAVHAVFPAARNAPSAAGVLLSSSVLRPCDGLLGLRSRGHPHGDVLYDRRAALCHLLWLQYHQHRWHARRRVHRRQRRRRYQRRRRRLRGRVSSAAARHPRRWHGAQRQPASPVLSWPVPDGDARRAVRTRRAQVRGLLQSLNENFTRTRRNTYGGWAGLGMGVEGRDEASRPVRQSARRHSGVYLTVGPPASASIAFFALKQKTIMGI